MAVAGKLQFVDLEPVGPGTPSGRQLRHFWQLVQRRRDLKPGHARPIEILGEKFTAYRGEDGTPHIRCTHRSTQLWLGQLEDNSLCCRYHGRKFDASGHSVEQPNEDRQLCARAGVTKPLRTPQLAAGLIALVLIGLGGGRCEAQAAANPAVAIAYNADSNGAASLWVAVDRGLFRHYGIDATLSGAMSSPVLIASILSGETQFAVTGEDAVIGADLNGGDIVIVATGTEKLSFSIEAAAGIHSVADLKGKKIGISQFGTTTDFIVRYVLKKAGLQPDQDASIIAVGSMSSRFAALKAGGVDAVVLGPPVDLMAEKAGFRVIADMFDSDLLFYTNAFVAKKSWVAAHRAETLNVVRGYLAGIAAVVTNKQAALASLAKYTKISDPEVLEQAYQMLSKGSLRIATLKPAALQTGLDESKLPAAKTADPARFIDASFVDELDKDGFVDSLYK